MRSVELHSKSFSDIEALLSVVADVYNQISWVSYHMLKKPRRDKLRKRFQNRKQNGYCSDSHSDVVVIITILPAAKVFGKNYSECDVYHGVYDVPIRMRSQNTGMANFEDSKTCNKKTKGKYISGFLERG